MAKARITGYQIQLATDGNFTKNKRTKTVKGYRNTSKKVTNLKAKKKYYIRIRTYKKTGKKNTGRNGQSFKPSLPDHFQPYNSIGYP